MTQAIHPTAIIDAGAQLGDDVSVGPYSIVGSDVILGDRVKLHGHVTISGHTTLGDDVEVYPYAAIGESPQILGFKPTSDSRVTVGARTILREYVTLHAGSPDAGGLTSIGEDCLFMVGSHAAHDCHIGDKCVIANNTAIGGHVTVGEQVWMGGAVAVHQHVTIGRHAFIGGGSILVGNVIPYGSTIGNQAHLAGLNVVGLKRRGFSRQTIHDLRAAYRLLFADEGTFSERVADTKQTYSDRPEVVEIVTFIEEQKSRPLCLPR